MYQYKEKTITQFTNQAEAYDSRYVRVNADYPEIMEELEKEPCADILDCGCGSGALIAALFARYPEKRYTGIDLTPKMIEVAGARGLDGPRFLVGDCENLPFEDASFDAVICSHSFHHYPEPQRFFNSVFRVLRPGGRLILRDNTGSRWFLWYSNHIGIPLSHLLSDMGDVKYYSRKEVEDFCRSAGLAFELFEERPNHKMHCVARKPR